MEDDFDPIKAAMFFTTAQADYTLTTRISKLGVGLVLFRLASGTNMRVCRPLTVAWGVRESSCLSTSVLGTTGRALSGIDVTISWFYALLPIYKLYKTQLRLKLKIMIMVLLGLGAVSSIAIIVRVKYLIDLSRLTSSSDGLATQHAVGTTRRNNLL
ncbi:hypothetical protein FPOAC1_006973 [Fusarium poae]|uniref:hypothetical protein n=1 Tax=Fusarium poae TaxID=36050 RepID=UPI001CEB9858|nr:hypothetical protein FPOAC1_006973 [Fusarium poae]KAG8673659.1 hypothetical protein FPOAC1_006973 [Fusarium poae]